MLITKTCLLALLITLVLLALPSRLSAQDGGRFEFGGDYNFVRANAGPGQCGCFNLQGGDGWLGWYLTDNVALIGQGAYQRANNINGTTASLDLASFMAGPRVSIRRSHRIVPFVQGLFGVAHGSGFLTPSSATGLSSSANAFALQAGGGIDFTVSRNFAIRVIQVDYFHTRFENGVNQSQNNVRLAAGFNFHF